jgi:hypothetical protein
MRPYAVVAWPGSQSGGDQRRTGSFILRANDKARREATSQYEAVVVNRKQVRRTTGAEPELVVRGQRDGPTRLG